jgi:uncharacterized protein YegL
MGNTYSRNQEEGTSEQYRLTFASHEGFLVPGGESEKILHAKFECCQEPRQTPAVRVLFVVDCSLSMKDSMKTVKKSLEFIVSRILESFEKDGSIHREIGVISFSDEAGIILPFTRVTNSNAPTFFEAVESLHVLGLTNISAALGMASQMVKISHERSPIPSVVIFLSDGAPTEGIQDRSSLISFAKRLPFPLGHIIAIGYGQHYDPILLAKIGQYVHIPGSEAIAPTIGAIYSVASTFFGTNASLNIFAAKPLRVYSSVMKNEGVVGPRDDYVIPIGLLFPGRTFEFLVSMTGVDRFTIKLEGHLWDPIQGKTVKVQKEIVTPSTKSNPLPLQRENQELYFTSEIGRLTSVMESRTQTDHEEVVGKIEKMCHSWTMHGGELGRVNAEKLLAIVKSLKDVFIDGPQTSLNLDAFYIASTTRSQTSYGGDYTTSYQNQEAQSAYVYVKQKPHTTV